jgi:hypothetical protein
MMPRIGLGRVAVSGIGVRQELIVPNRPTCHEIEANTMFDRLDGWRVGFDVVVVDIDGNSISSVGEAQTDSGLRHLLSSTSIINPHISYWRVAVPSAITSEKPAVTTASTGNVERLVWRVS